MFCFFGDTQTSYNIQSGAMPM